jgi:hypothetical protein
MIAQIVIHDIIDIVGIAVQLLMYLLDTDSNKDCGIGSTDLR